ncbi:hypothetical protein C4546_00845 [Candidatus Parcubacteria bacterium]|jgi:hypothetical protein|nr:MAG: hypothetical protein C4546_00845 [Candidatus Parcubacteria bacterium]
MLEKIAYSPEENPIVEQSKFDSKTEKIVRESINSQLDTETEGRELADSWDRLLSLFGTEKARGRFIKLCQDYRDETYAYQQRQVAETHSRQTSSSPDSKKSAIHNEIMQILRNLITAKNWPEDDYRLLDKLQDRKAVEKMLNNLSI